MVTFVSRLTSKEPPFETWSYCDQLNVRGQLYITALLRVDLCHVDTYDDDDDDSDDDDDGDSDDDDEDDDDTDGGQLAQRALIFCSLAQPTTQPLGAA